MTEIRTNRTTASKKESRAERFVLGDTIAFEVHRAEVDAGRCKTLLAGTRVEGDGLRAVSRDAIPHRVERTEVVARSGRPTRFLPFNRGYGHGGGNPPRPGDYRTGYLWAEVWERESFLDLLGRFLHVSIEEKQVAGKLVTTETVILQI